MGLFSSKGSKVKQTEEQIIGIEARRDLQALIKTLGPEDVPLREIAPLSDLENKALELAREFLSDTSAEVTIDKAIEIATQIAESPVDFDSELIQSAIGEVRREGDLALNRIGRQLQSQGTLSTSGGRDILGRKITDIRQAEISAATPLILAERDRKERATSLLPQFAAAKSGQRIGKIAVGQEAGSLLRNLQQAIKNATFNKQTSELNLQTSVIPNLLKSLFTGVQSPNTISGGGPNELEKFSKIATDITGAAAAAGSLLNLSGSVGSGFKSAFFPKTPSNAKDPLTGQVGIAGF